MKRKKQSSRKINEIIEEEEDKDEDFDFDKWEGTD
jgi:hypothetical protein